MDETEWIEKLGVFVHACCWRFLKCGACSFVNNLYVCACTMVATHGQMYPSAHEWWVPVLDLCETKSMSGNGSPWLKGTVMPWINRNVFKQLGRLVHDETYPH